MAIGLFDFKRINKEYVNKLSLCESDKENGCHDNIPVVIFSWWQSLLYIFIF